MIHFDLSPWQGARGGFAGEYNQIKNDAFWFMSRQGNVACRLGLDVVIHLGHTPFRFQACAGCAIEYGSVARNGTMPSIIQDA
jgi:hypothetical protein